VIGAATVVAALAATAGARQQTPTPQTESKPSCVPFRASDVAAPRPTVKTKSACHEGARAGHRTEHPKADDIVTVHYTGWNTKGEMFDSCTPGQAQHFGVNRVIAGWAKRCS